MYSTLHLFLCLCVLLLSVSAAKQPNIVVILCDDLGWNDVGFHGSNQIPTPNIDALAYSGVILNRHYVLPTCTPSRTALLTGTHPIKQGMQGFPMRAGEPRGIPLDVKLLPEYLKDLNYATHLVGKWHVGYVTEDHLPHKRGFDSFFGYYNGYIEYFKYGLIEPRRVLGSKLLYYGYDLHHNTDNDCFVEYQGEYATRAFTDRAEDIITTHDKDKPLFLMLSHLAVHVGSGEGSGLEVPQDMDVNATFPHIEAFERRQFAGVMTELDKSVGRIVKALEDNLMLQDTIIVFMADNGAQPVSVLMQPNWGSNYPLRGGKFNLFEGGVRGSAFVWSPLIPRGAISNHLIHMTDWLPTLYSAAGGLTSSLPSYVDGVNMWHSLHKPETRPLGRDLFLNIDEVEGTQGIIIDGRWKLVRGGIRNYAEYDRHLGQTPTNDSDPEYDLSLVRNSMAGRAVLGKLTSKHLKNLREQATVNCDCPRVEPQFGYVNKSHEFLCRKHCLFDIQADPCECAVVRGREDIRRRAVRLLKEYQKLLVPQTNGEVDPASNPDNFGGVWLPWRPKRSTSSTGNLTSIGKTLFALSFSLLIVHSIHLSLL